MIVDKGIHANWEDIVIICWEGYAFEHNVLDIEATKIWEGDVIDLEARTDVYIAM